MKMEQVRSHARDLGVKPGRMDKATLIRTIQREEGNFDCFATASEGVCDQQACLWRDDCFTTARMVVATKPAKRKAA